MRSATPKDLATVKEYNDFYEEAYHAWGSFYPLTDRGLRFYLGDQWDAQRRKDSLKKSAIPSSSIEHVVTSIWLLITREKADLGNCCFSCRALSLY